MINVTELMARVVLLEVEALAAIGVNADAVPYFLHTQESFPYFTNRVSGITAAADSEDFDVDTYQVTMRLVIGHISEGYVGEPETDLYTYIPQIKHYMNQREGLQAATVHTGYMDHLVRARVTSSPGLRIFQNTGIGAQQVGADLILTCLFEEQIEPAFS